MIKTMNRITFSAALLAAFVVAGISTGCGSTTGANVNANTVANTAANTAAAPAATAVPTAAAVSDADIAKALAGSPSDVYKAAYAARERKDIETLKKVFAKDILEFFKMMGKDEGKTIEDSLKEMTENPQGKTDDTRNEKINGDKATIEYLDDKGEWRTMDFIKEDGVWKMTLDGPGADKNTTSSKP
jgi:hypothetical protein